MSFAAHRARKRFGQHWLKDQSVLDRILQAAALTAADTVLEVGPGRGALTERLLESSARAVCAVELDRDLVSGLSRSNSGPVCGQERIDDRLDVAGGEAFGIEEMPMQ